MSWKNEKQFIFKAAQFIWESRQQKMKAGYKIIEEERLENAVNCKHCHNRKSKMKLFHLPSVRKGLAEHLILRCCSTCCCHGNYFMNSRKSTVNKEKSVNAYDIGIRSTLPLAIEAAYNSVMKNIYFVAIQNDTIINLSRGRSWNYHWIILPGGEVFGRVAIIVVGTWQKRQG